MSRVSSSTQPGASTTSSRSRRPKRAPSPPPEILDRSKRSRKLGERGIIAAGQKSSLDEDSSEESDEQEESEDEWATSSALSRTVKLKVIGPSKPGGARHTTEGDLKVEDSPISSAMDQGGSTSSSSSVGSPSDIARTLVWDSTRNQLVTTEGDAVLDNQEILTFPVGSYFGDVSPADVDRANAFIKLQSCVCGHKLYNHQRPMRMRRHFVDCAKRKEVFEEKGEVDALARLCELQVEAHRKPVIESSSAVDSRAYTPTRASSPVSSSPTQVFDDEDGASNPTVLRLAGAPRPRRTTAFAEETSRPSPPSPTATAPPRKQQAKIIQASNGKVVKWQRGVEQESLLRAIIHDNIGLTPIVQLHPPASTKSAILPSPRAIRPSCISHISAADGSTLSHYRYILPCAKIWHRAGVSVQLDGGEVHVEEEVRFLLGHEGGEVLLRVRGNDVEWKLIYAR